MQANAREEQVLDVLQRRYEADGFSFVRHPSGSALPEFLRGASPDAIAMGPDRKIVIGVKTSRSLHDKGRLAQVARLLQGHRDWHYAVFYADDLGTGDDALPVPSKEAVEKEIAEVRSQLRNGSVRAALVSGWALLEAVTRRVAPSAFQHAPKTAGTIAELLGREGLISDEDLRWLLKLVELRNAIVHGDLDREVRGEDVELLAKVAETLNASA